MMFLKIIRQDIRTLLVAVVVVSIVFSEILYVQHVQAEAVNLTATVATSLTFTTTSDNFGTITPGTYKIATTTLRTSTNNTAGWNITLFGDDTATANTTMDLDTDAAVGITDQTQWIPGAATSTVGNAVVRASLDNTGDVLAFRVMTASSTNGAAFTSSSWWGTTDADGTAKYAGIASTTVQRQIGNAGTGSYSASVHINTVQYYLDVAATQQTGAYSAPLTYTATAN